LFFSSDLFGSLRCGGDGGDNCSER
jgi:hypothetical protein